MRSAMWMQDILAGSGQRPVICESDRMMVAEGLRVPPLQRAHIEKKSPEERELIRLRKRQCGKAKYQSIFANHKEDVGTLKVHVWNRNHKNDFKTTLTFTCTMSEVPGILYKVSYGAYHFKYFNSSYMNQKIIKKFFNGKLI